MRYLKTIKALAFILAICVFFASCKNFEDFNEIEEIELEGSYAIPLINSSANLQDILDETSTQNDLSGLIIDNDGSMKVAYKNEAITQHMSDFFEEIPSFPIVIPSNSNQIPFDLFEGVDVEQMNLKSGTLSFELESYHEETVNVLITIPNLIKDGVAFNVTQTINYNGNAPATASIPPVDLTGYSFHLPNGQLEVYYQANNTNGDNLQISPIFGMAENWDYEYMQGIWEKDTISLSTDTLDIDIFDNWVDGTINFANPSLTILIENSFGFPTMAQVEVLKVVTATGEEMFLQSTLFDDPMYLNYPAITEPNTSKLTTLSFNNTNSNIADILNSKPTQIIYSITAVINPDESSSTSGFMTDESAMSIALETELPMHGSASGFELEEPLESDLSDLDNIEWAEFKVITNNGLPVDLGIQLYFTNDAGEKIDSLYNGFERLTESAVVNNTGDVVSSTEKVTLIDVSADRMENIRQSNHLVVGVTFSTVDDGNTAVKILTSHQLDLKVGLKVGLKN